MTTGSNMIITKGAPEGLLARCTAIPAAARAMLEAEFAAGNRVIAVATEGRTQAGRRSRWPTSMIWASAASWCSSTRRKPTPHAALQQLAGLGGTVKILTGDNATVAAKVCADLGLPHGQVATGADIDNAGDQLGDLLARTTVFAHRVSPEHKAQLVREQRFHRRGCGLPGDGVNDTARAARR